MGTSISGGKDSAKDKQIDALNAQARDCWIGTPRLRGLVPDDSRWERLNRSAAEFVERKNLGDLATCGVVNLFYYLLICDKLDAGVFLELPRKSIPLPREFCWAEEGIEEDVEIIDSFKTQQEGAYYPLVDFDPDQDPPNELATRKRRIARDDEEVVHVPELDRLSKMEVVSFNTYFAGVRKRVGKDSAALHHATLRAYILKYVEPLQDQFYSIFDVLERRKKIDPNTATTSDLPDLKFVDSSGRVLFENFGHMCSVFFRISRFFQSEQKKAQEAGQDDGIFQYPIELVNCPIEMLYHSGSAATFSW